MSWYEILFYVLMVGNIALRVYKRYKKKKAKEAEKVKTEPLTEVDYEVKE